MSRAKAAYWASMSLDERRRRTEPARRASVCRRREAAELLRAVEAGEVTLIPVEVSR